MRKSALARKETIGASVIGSRWPCVCRSYKRVLLAPPIRNCLAAWRGGATFPWELSSVFACEQASVVGARGCEVALNTSKSSNYRKQYGWTEQWTQYPHTITLTPPNHPQRLSTRRHPCALSWLCFFFLHPLILPWCFSALPPRLQSSHFREALGTCLVRTGLSPVFCQFARVHFVLFQKAAQNN